MPKRSRLVVQRVSASPGGLSLLDSLCNVVCTSDLQHFTCIQLTLQGSLPIVGLISRLASPEGGFDELAYPEYSRSIIEKSSEEMQSALMDLEKKYGKVIAASEGCRPAAAAALSSARCLTEPFSYAWKSHVPSSCLHSTSYPY